MARTWAEVQAQKKTNTRSVILVLDPEPGERLQRARIRVAEAQARLDLDKDDREAKAAQRELKAEVAQAEDDQKQGSYEFRFESPGLAVYREVLESHQPTPKQIKTAEEKNQARPDYNADTFPPALVAACCVSPEDFDEVAAKVMWHDPKWSPAELNDLFEAAFLVCDRRQYVWDLGKGSSSTLD